MPLQGVCVLYALKGHKSVSRGHRPREIRVTVGNVRGKHAGCADIIVEIARIRMIRPEGAKACRSQSDRI